MRDSDLNAYADKLNASYSHFEATELIFQASQRIFPGRTALTTSFGTESVVLLALVARIDPHLPVFFINTGKHFPETLAYRDEIVSHLGLTAVREIKPYDHQIAAADPDGTLFSRDPDYCCHLRKVIPFEDALEGFDCWIAGRKRVHGGVRADLRIFEAQGERIQVSPLAHWSVDDIERTFRDLNLPRHPLYREGYRSIGCANCTARTPFGGDPRGGRWHGHDKIECGLHLARNQSSEYPTSIR
ncbi:MAG: phosphoadenylyl-sulfate reductase [Kiloniellales bacterium]|nr:phosphoadenylyl-sulfate reductase [Kiloniellales bacterium]